MIYGRGWKSIIYSYRSILGKISHSIVAFGTHLGYLIIGLHAAIGVNGSDERVIFLVNLLHTAPTGLKSSETRLVSKSLLILRR